MLPIRVKLGIDGFSVAARVDSYPFIEAFEIDCIQPMQSNLAFADVAFFVIYLITKAGWDTIGPAQGCQQMCFCVTNAGANRENLTGTTSYFFAPGVKGMRNLIAHPLKQCFGFCTVVGQTGGDLVRHFPNGVIVPINLAIGDQIIFNGLSLHLVCDRDQRQRPDIPQGQD